MMWGRPKPSEVALETRLSHALGQRNEAFRARAEALQARAHALDDRAAAIRDRDEARRAFEDYRVSAEVKMASLEARLAKLEETTPSAGLVDDIRHDFLALRDRLYGDKHPGRLDKALHCSFCGKNHRDVMQLIAGPTVFICDECVDVCTDIVTEAKTNRDAEGGAE